jgi:hypothetical protein
VQIESKEDTMKKSQNDEDISDLLNPEDVQFLHQLFETEAKLSEGGRGTDSGSQNYEHHRSDSSVDLSSNRRQSYRTAQDSEAASSSSQYDKPWNLRRRTVGGVNEDSGKSNAYRKGEINIDSLEKVIEDLSDFIDNY